VPRTWAGVDIGKEHHHCVVIDADGQRLLSRRVLNDETALLELIGDVLALDTDVLWAIDLNHGGAALLIGLLLNHEQPMVYITGLTVHRASASYRGEGKTDAKDAFVIADQARMRRDLGVLRPGDEIAVDLRTLTTRRTDLVCDRTRQINRLRAQLLEIFPALERALDLTNKGPVLLLTGYQTPAAIRHSGATRIQTWLRHRKVRGAAALAETAVRAAEAQHTTLPGIGKQTGAVFIAATGGDLDAFGSADRLAGYAGLAPAPRDSGRVSGNLRRPRRFHRGLLTAMYLSALSSLTSSPASKAFYVRKRAEGKGHKQALLALARRRVNVLWAMIRDGTPYQAAPPTVTAA
jgi:transposase